MISQFRKISLMLAYFVATIPLWHYISDGRIILLMTIVVLFAYLMIVFSSVEAAKTILSSEKAKTPTPHWLPNKLKYEKWWLIVRHTAKWHLLLVPAKMGLAFGFVMWLHLGVEWSATNDFFRPYFYTSNSFDFIYPQWETCLIAVLLLLLISLCEIGFLSAFVCINQSFSRLLVLRVLLSLSIVGVMSQYREFYHRIPTIDEACRFEPCTACYGMGCNAAAFWNLQHYRTRIGETIETAFYTLDEMGILLAANIMRPMAGATSFGMIPQTDKDGHLFYIKDNRRFVLRQVVAGGLGILLYLGTTWVILWFVEDEPITKQTETAQSSKGHELN